MEIVIIKQISLFLRHPVLDEIFHYTETGTNVAGTNVPMTVANFGGGVNKQSSKLGSV